ncbi:MAG: lipoprotein [Pseudomonadota bacterium]|nr:lipoprotein [Pseudomonadota bacterium]
MMKRALILAALSLALAACGVKSDLVMPSGKQTPSSQTDPSRPPQPVGR